MAGSEMTVKKALILALKAMQAERKKIIVNANLYRFYKDRAYSKDHLRCLDIEEAMDLINKMVTTPEVREGS